ncbi:glycosyltransferase [Vibrio vulnificus]|nr:glycosyltransferase [Vibrio vulnificus]
MTTRTPILFVHYGDNWIRGSETTLIHLLATLDTQQFEPIVWSNCQPLLDHLTQCGITTYQDPFSVLGVIGSNKFNPLNTMKLVARAITLIQRHHIALIHVNSGAPCQWMSIAARLCHCPLLLQLHGDYPLRERFLMGFHLADNIVCVSDAISQAMQSEGLALPQLSVVHNGVCLPSSSLETSLKTQLSIPRQAFTFITIGSLIARKGVDRLLKALYLLKKNGEKAHLVIIGDGPERITLEHLSETLGLSEQVHWLGEKANAAIWLKSDADAFVSGAYQEAFGLVIAEAMMAELPVIAPRTGGIPEFVSHNQNGLLYHNSGVFSLVQAMQKLMLNPALSHKLKQTAYVDAHENLTIQCNTQTLQAHYLALMKRDQPAPQWRVMLRPLLYFFRRKELLS